MNEREIVMTEQERQLSTAIHNGFMMSEERLLANPNDRIEIDINGNVVNIIKDSNNAMQKYLDSICH